MPYRKDLFVEVDWMDCGARCSLAAHSHTPQQSAIDDLVQAFANAPVDPYPDPSDVTKTKNLGINLHLMQDEAIAEQLTFSWEPADSDFNKVKHGDPIDLTPGKCSGSFSTAADRSSQNCAKILDAERQVFRYMIFVHRFKV